LVGRDGGAKYSSWKYPLRSTDPTGLLQVFVTPGQPALVIVYSGGQNKADSWTGIEYSFSAKDTMAAHGYINTTDSDVVRNVVSGGGPDKDARTPSGVYFDVRMTACSNSGNKDLDSKAYGGPGNAYIQLGITSPAEAVGDACHQVRATTLPDRSYTQGCSGTTVNPGTNNSSTKNWDAIKDDWGWKGKDVYGTVAVYGPSEAAAAEESARGYYSAPVTHSSDYY
jgi:hypothetical protein